MPVLIPEHPIFAIESERRTWELLRDSLGEGDFLLANLRLTDAYKDHEADLVVLLDGIGVCVLEVKGGSVWFDDGWKIQRGGRPVSIHPVDQARDSKYALRAYVENDPRWGSRGRVAWAHGVVTPHSNFDEDFDVPELPRWALHDRADQAALAERLRDNTLGMAHGKRLPSFEDLEVIAEILGGKPTSYDPAADAEARGEVADRLTQEQALILDVTRMLHRVEVRGGAGSGKTVLALQQAKQLTRGRPDKPAQRVALLCYSLGLAAHLKRQVATWHRKERPAFVGTFHELGVLWGAPDSDDRDNSRFWEVELPERMAELAENLPFGQRFDAVVVDEAQDFADLWWVPVLGALRDEEASGVYAYSDENQRIFARFGRPPLSLTPLVLDHNLRNTKQIYETFAPLAPSRMYARGGEGPQVRFIECSADDAIDVADDVVDSLIDEGWSPGHLALLTTGNRHPEQVERARLLGQEGYWETFWDDDQVFYGHVLGFKGLERRVVVLCVNEGGVRERARERLYVGMSRATDLLVVVGDPEVIRAAGGESVARRLNLAPASASLA